MLGCSLAREKMLTTALPTEWRTGWWMAWAELGAHFGSNTGDSEKQVMIPAPWPCVSEGG